MYSMKNKAARRIVTVFLCVVLVLSSLPANVKAAGKPKLSSKKITLEVRQSKKISIKGIKSKEIKKATWSSSKKSVARVNSKGKITGVRAGNATITCRIVCRKKDGSKGKKYTLKCRVTVKKQKADKPDNSESSTEEPTQTQEPSVTEPPKTEEPTAEPQITETPQPTEPPSATEPPKTEEPTTEPQPTEQPTTEPAVTEQPTEQPAESPSVSEPLQTTDYELNGVSFKMIFVEGGTFTMGSDSRAQGSGTQVSNQAGEHQVTLSSYLIGETEVTRALWNEVMYGSHSESDLNYPIASVTVPQCRIFVEKLNEKAHAAGIIPDSRNFHMLTEAQWEFAAKGGNASRGYTYAGSNTLSEVAWTSDDGGSVHMVKQKKPNELGIYDMSGNVYEWVADYAAPYSAEAQTNPCNTTPGSNYIKRGGSFYYNDEYRFTSTYRYFYSATDYTIGVRIGLY